MDLTEQDDVVGAFTLELLRVGEMFFGLAADLIEATPAEAYPGEDAGAVVIEMMTGTIRTALGEVAAEELERATQLITVARDRVLEHLRLTLELSRRMHGEGGRTYG